MLLIFHSMLRRKRVSVTVVVFSTGESNNIQFLRFSPFWKLLKSHLERSEEKKANAAKSQKDLKYQLPLNKKKNRKMKKKKNKIKTGDEKRIEKENRNNSKLKKKYL